MSKRTLAPLQLDRVRLRLLEEADLPMTLAWRNRPDIRKWFLNSELITPDQHRAWYAQYRHRDDDFVFVIEETDRLQRPIGQISLYRVDAKARRAEFGRLLIGDPAANGQGLAQLATRCLLQAASSMWMLNEVYLEVRAANHPAIAVYAACGFTEVDRNDAVVHMRCLLANAN